jgi:hypothetical protein
VEREPSISQAPTVAGTATASLTSGSTRPASTRPASTRPASAMTRMVRAAAHRLGWPTAFVAALFLAGFVLPVWWLAAPAPRGVLGLSAFPSAYIGDTVLLPVGCLVMLRGVRRLHPARMERVVAAVAASVTAAIVIAMQADWLFDRTAQPNWTEPRIGDFDAAGWWHAVYFTGMSIILVVLTVVFLSRVRQERLAGRRAVLAEVSSGRGAAVLLAAWGSYAALAIHDDLSGMFSRSAASSLALVAFVLLLVGALVGVAYGRLAALLARPAAAANCGIAAVTVLVMAPPATHAWIGTGIVLLLVALAVIDHGRHHGRPAPPGSPGGSRRPSRRPPNLV